MASAVPARSIVTVARLAGYGCSQTTEPSLKSRIATGSSYGRATAIAGIFHAGLASAGDRKYTVVPQRDRLRHRDRPSAEPS